jgi:CheY-like chemotaxis protein
MEGNPEGRMTQSRNTVLLVENNSDDARLVELAFERAQVTHSLMVLTNALDAMDYLKGKGRYAERRRFPLPKLILLDLGLPRVSGFAMLEQLQLDPVLRDLPVTVLSGSDYMRDVNRAYQLGAKSFLVKPSDFEGFSAAIKETLDFWLCGRLFTGPPVYLQMPHVSNLESRLETK